MAKKKPSYRTDYNPSPFDKARDELLSHILQCGVLEADLKRQKEWFDDTMEYMAERYAALSPEDLTAIRTVGEQYCRPVRRHSTEEVGAKD